MELRHLRYFVAVAEELNFRRAAQRLHISQPSLSAQVRQLEKLIGTPLLIRDTHRVTLTAAGSHFLENARRILGDVEDAARTAQRIGSGSAGILTVGFVESLAHDLLPRVLRAYRQNFPDVELQLLEMDTSRQIEALNQRELDVGLIGLGLSTAVSDLCLATIDEEPLMAALPQQHPLAAQYPQTLPLQALADQPFYLAERESAPLYNPWILVLCQQAGFAPQVIKETGQPITVLGYVAAGLGVTILPAQFARMATTGVRFIPLQQPAPSYRYCVAWLPQNAHSALEHFVKAAQNSATAR